MSTAEPGFFRELWNQVRLVFQLLKDRDVPIYLKVLPFVGLAYVIFPVDFIPDVIPGLGQLDDLTVIVVGLKMFIELAPTDIVNKYLNQMRGVTGQDKVIEGDASDVIKEPKSLTEPIIIDADETDEKNG
jgi:uncharacterized membrane protein YkvA (DUF1232 family)